MAGRGCGRGLLVVPSEISVVAQFSANWRVSFCIQVHNQEVGNVKAAVFVMVHIRSCHFVRCAICCFPPDWDHATSARDTHILVQETCHAMTAKDRMEKDEHTLA